MSIFISVIIVTKDRQKQLHDCLKALLTNSYKNFELIIIDQSKKAVDINSLKQSLKKFSRLKYVKSNQLGKSKGLNLAIKLSSANILAFTDDDCIPSKDWVMNISQTMKNYPKVVATFGRTLPFQEKKHPGLVCPATFKSKKMKLITKPCKHWEEIGFGNNMAWRKEFFNAHGLFKEWLGPGSIGNSAAEDAEIALRALINKKTILYNPLILMQHNKWLKNKELHKLELSYVCGEMACYGYLALAGHNIGKEVVKSNLQKLLSMSEKKYLTKNVSRLKGLVIAYLNNHRIGQLKNKF